MIVIFSVLKNVAKFFWDDVLGYCAVLNNQSHNLNFVACKALEGCPGRSYTFNELYNCKYMYVQYLP